MYKTLPLETVSYSLPLGCIVIYLSTSTNVCMKRRLTNRFIAIVVLLVFYAPSVLAETVANDPLYQLAKDFNDPTTHYLVARKYYTGNEYPLDKAKAANWFKKAADAGHAKAAWYLGRMYAKGDGVKKNTKMAIQYLQKASQSGQEEASYDLGLVYLNNMGNKPDYDNASKWLSLAAKTENARAAFLLGKLAVEGKIRDDGFKQSRQWLRLASELGIEGAKDFLERVEQKISSQQNQSPSESRSEQEPNSKLDKELDKIGSSTVLVTQISSLLKSIESNQRQPRDSKEVKSAIMKALKGDAKAQYHLGMQLMQSPASRNLAVEWLRKASQQGHNQAAYQLGVLYRDGNGVQRSQQEAANLFRQAAAADESDPETAEKAATALNDMRIKSNNKLLNEKVVTSKLSALDSLRRDAANGRIEAKMKLANMRSDSSAQEKAKTFVPREDETDQPSEQPNPTQSKTAKNTAPTQQAETETSEKESSSAPLSHLRCRRC